MASTPVRVPASLAALFRDAGFNLTLMAEPVSGGEPSAYELRLLDRLSRGYELQHPTPEIVAADVDVLDELRKMREAAAPTLATASAPTPSTRTGTGGE